MKPKWVKATWDYPSGRVYAERTITDKFSVKVYYVKIENDKRVIDEIPVDEFITKNQEHIYARIKTYPFIGFSTKIMAQYEY